MALSWLVTRLAGWLIAAQPAAPRSSPPPRVDTWLLWWHYLALLGVVLIGVLALYFFMRWWRRAGPERPSASDQLTEFRQLYEQGQLSAEEFERLRSLLGERMRRETEGQPPAPTQPAPPAAPPRQGESPRPDSPNGPATG
jgi:hypothetical protein